jgi:hypothetical protein
VLGIHSLLLKFLTVPMLGFYDDNMMMMGWKGKEEVMRRSL